MRITHTHILIIYVCAHRRDARSASNRNAQVSISLLDVAWAFMPQLLIPRDNLISTQSSACPVDAVHKCRVPAILFIYKYTYLCMQRYFNFIAPCTQKLELLEWGVLLSAYGAAEFYYHQGTARRRRQRMQSKAINDDWTIHIYDGGGERKWNKYNIVLLAFWSIIHLISACRAHRT